MRLVFLSFLHGFGGAEKQNVMLANAMVERGHEVTLISICSDNSCYKLDDRVKYIFLPDRRNNILRILYRYIDIYHLLKSIKPDFTISFWFQTAYLTAMMSKRVTGKIVYSERGDPGDSEYKGLLGLIRRLSLHRIDGFVFQTSGAQTYFDKTVQNRSTIIPNPVFIKKEDFPDVHIRSKDIVTIGRLHHQKNHKLLINAFSKISNDIPEYKLKIYGDGVLKADLQKQIDYLGLKERVFLKGTSKEVHKLIYDATLFVLSSDFEGIPNTLLEAMALGIPCISTDCRPGGAREIIDHGDNGIIVDINDTDGLSNAILSIVNNPIIQTRFSENSIKKMQLFRPQIIYDKWEQFFSTANKNI